MDNDKVKIPRWQREMALQWATLAERNGERIIRGLHDGYSPDTLYVFGFHAGKAAREAQRQLSLLEEGE